MKGEPERAIKLLIVDDEVAFLEALGERLELRDFQVRTVSNSKDALELCRQEKFDLALVDLKMPDMNGQELLSRIKGAHRHLEVIILTGHGSLSSAVDCTKLGAFDYLPKPYKLDELLKVLRDAYAERLRKKFSADEARTRELMDIARSESPREVLRRMRELDDHDR